MYILNQNNGLVIPHMEAFEQKIPDGLVRILIRVEDIKCKVHNAAPDHLSPEKDEIFIRLNIDHPFQDELDILNEDHPLEINKRKSDDEFLVLELKNGGIWFDIEMDKVKDIWISEYVYEIRSKNSRFLKYSIRDLSHTIEWLQEDEQSGEINSLSNFTKKFTPASIALEESYSADEILQCADMIGKAIHKIDLRSRSALIKLNTEEGRLEHLIMEIADRLGYEISALEESELTNVRKSGGIASHSIRLKR
ncbi:hypothetical protein AB2B38_009470 [Balneola sp. MJW-20]|uniref:hypothetical protein n=1 Tax=Gracilimonas aurantiaca TaxID=3234185 RepID=UPI003466A5D0